MNKKKPIETQQPRYLIQKISNVKDTKKQSKSPLNSYSKLTTSQRTKSSQKLIQSAIITDKKEKKSTSIAPKVPQSRQDSLKTDQSKITQSQVVQSQPVQRKSVYSGRVSNLGQIKASDFVAVGDDLEDNKIKQKNIRVFCRFRPLSQQEKELSQNGLGQICIQFPNMNTVLVKGEQDQAFTFDEVFDENVNSQQIFEQVSRKSLNDVLLGFNATLFCYGQTGSGKTFTMYGLDVKKQIEMGIIPRAIIYLFESIAEQADPDIEFVIEYSMLEIYKEQLIDLLTTSRYNLQIKEDLKKGIYVQGLQQISVASFQESMELLELGQQNKSIAATRLNQHSSRAHTIFIVQIIQRYSDGSEKKGVLNLIDLAGSEKISKTGAEGETLEEAKKINLSLTCLGTVINSLTSNKDHIPYRDSKLTRLLQESLGGNYKTSLIINCSMHSSSMEETCTTLRFGTRAKSIKNNYKMNMVLSPEKMQKIIDELKAQIVIKDQIIELGAEKTNNKMKKQSMDIITQDVLTNRKKEDDLQKKIQDQQIYINQLENKNSELEKKTTELKQQLNMQSSGEILKLKKQINELSEERDSLQWKFENSVSKFELLNKQLEFFKFQQIEINGQLQIAKTRDQKNSQDKQNLMQNKYNDYLNQNFQEFYKNYTRSNLQSYEGDDNLQQKSQFELCLNQIQNLQKLSQQSSQILASETKDQELLMFFFQNQIENIIDNLDYLLKTQESTYKIEYEKFRIKSDYSYSQDKQIQGLEEIYEKAIQSHSSLRKKIENIEMNMFKVQEMSAQLKEYGQTDLQSPAVNIKKRVNKLTMSTQETLRKMSIAVNQPTTMYDNQSQIKYIFQEGKSIDQYNPELERMQKKILILQTEIDQEKYKSQKLQDVFSLSTKQIKKQQTLIQNYDAFTLEAEARPFISLQFNDLQKMFELFQQWIQQFMKLVRDNGFQQNEAQQDIEFFMNQNSYLCDQTILDFVKMQKNAIQVGQNI